MTEARDQLQKLTECCICFKTFSDPRMLPCIHTFCLDCLKQTSQAAKKKPTEKMPCPLCRNMFAIPAEGMNGLQKNFFMQHLMDVTTLQLGQKPVIDCDICKVLHEGDKEKTKKATMRCLECGDNFCDMCSKAHKLHKSSKTHNIVRIGCETEEDIRKMQSTRNCTVHSQQPLNFYCSDCKKIICVSCFVENHASHKCKDVTTVEKEFRRTIEMNALKISNCAEEMLSNEKMVEQRATEVLLNLAQTEDKIRKRNVELKEMIDRDTASLLDELSLIKQKQVKDIAIDKEDIERMHTILTSFETYCNELISKGSASDVCSCVDDLVTRANELGKDHKAFIVRPYQKTDVSFKTTDLGELLSTSGGNIVGQIQDQWQSDDGAYIDTDTDTDAKTKKDETTNETVGNLPKFEHHVQSSILSKNASATFDMHTEEDDQCEDRENCGLTFPEELAMYKEMLEKLRSQILPFKVRAKDRRPLSVLKIEETAKLRLQFNQVRRTRPVKWETTHWKSIERCHEQLVSLACREAEDDRFQKILDEMRGITVDLLKQIAAMEARSHQGLSNFGKTCNFNAVIQCLCQTFPLLEDLSSRNTKQQPLTEAFVKFLNYRYVGAHEQDETFSKFLKQLFMSSPKFNNFQQHDSHDLFIHFLHDLRSEERLHTTKDPRFNIDPRKVLTTVDKVFGGHFITMYACLKCDQPYFVCECLLDISLPICIPEQQQQQQWPYSGGGTYQMSGKRLPDSAVDRRQQLSQTTSYSHQDKELTRVLLEALNEEQRIRDDERRRYRTRPVTVAECLRFYTATEHIPEGYLCLSCQDGNQSGAAVNAQTMPPAMKRTLIYNPPAILVLHLKGFERTSTGFTKRSDRVTYEELLDLGPYCSSDCLRIDAEDKNVWYSLYGVVVHSGSVESGHYAAYVKIRDSNTDATKPYLQRSFLERDRVATEQKKNLASGGKRANRKLEWQPIPATDGKWIHVSDSNSRDATLHEALNQEAFMLFYERVPKHGQ